MKGNRMIATGWCSAGPSIWRAKLPKESVSVIFLACLLSVCWSGNSSFKPLGWRWGSPTVVLGFFVCLFFSSLLSPLLCLQPCFRPWIMNSSEGWAQTRERMAVQACTAFSFTYLKRKVGFSVQSLCPLYPTTIDVQFRLMWLLELLAVNYLRILTF